MIDINKLTEEEFKALPSVAEGESKEVRYAGKGLVVNRFKDNNGNRLADEILPDELADWYINTKKARGTALKVGDVVAEFLNEYDIVFYDLCLFITEDGETVFGEISQDCGRYRHFDLGSLDKDAWRAGGSSEIVLKKWDLLLKYITDKGGE